MRRFAERGSCGGRIIEWAKGSFYKQYAALIGLSGTTAGIINNTPVVAMMIPMAVEAAELAGGDPFSFVLVVTFAASCALLTPIGYQTHLMVYGPGGYRFPDFVWMGTPLQLVLAIVTCGGIQMIWGV